MLDNEYWTFYIISIHAQQNSRKLNSKDRQMNTFNPDKHTSDAQVQNRQLSTLKNSTRYKVNF